MNDVFSQAPFPVRFEWGIRGARLAAARGHIVIIVDVLSFSSAVTVAAHTGIPVYPVQPGASAGEIATRTGAVVAVHRYDVPHKGAYSLSPLTFLLKGPFPVVLPSPNGSLCSAVAAEASAVLAGSLLNAHAVADYAYILHQAINQPITVIACGEQWPESPAENGLRPALEDYLGAGAILSHLAAVPGGLSPEAEVCRLSFTSVHSRIADLVSKCGSGRELYAKGFGEDVLFSARTDIYDAVPVLTDGAFRNTRTSI